MIKLKSIVVLSLMLGTVNADLNQAEHESLDDWESETVERGPTAVSRIIGQLELTPDRLGKIGIPASREPKAVVSDTSRLGAHNVTSSDMTEDDKLVVVADQPIIDGGYHGADSDTGQGRIFESPELLRGDTIDGASSISTVLKTSGFLLVVLLLLVVARARLFRG